MYHSGPGRVKPGAGARYTEAMKRLPLLLVLAVALASAASAQTKKPGSAAKPRPKTKARAKANVPLRPPAPKPPAPPPPAPVPAPPPAPETPLDPEVALAEGKARLAAAIQAHGGAAFLGLKGLVLKGQGQAAPPGGGAFPFESVTLAVALPDRARMDARTTIGEITLANPGGGQKAWLRMSGGVQDSPYEAINDPLQVLRVAQQLHLAVRALPETEEGRALTAPDGKPLLGFVVPFDAVRQAKVYIEKETGLVRRIVAPAVGAEAGATILLSGYRVVDGVSLPGAFALVQEGSERISLSFESAEVNPTLPADHFERPKP